jgi:hypothetical protein
MAGDLDTAYLAGLPADRRAGLERVNAPGLTALRGYLKSGEAVAFLGAGASVPLYPLWGGLIGELVDAAAARLSEAEAATCRALAGSAPEEVVEIVRRSLGGPFYHAVLREVLRVRTDPVTGRPVVDGRAGAGVPVCAPRRGDHELRPGDRGCADAGAPGCVGDGVHDLAGRAGPG